MAMNTESRFARTSTLLAALLVAGCGESTEKAVVDEQTTRLTRSTTYHYSAPSTLFCKTKELYVQGFQALSSDKSCYVAIVSFDDGTTAWAMLSSITSRLARR